MGVDADRPEWMDRLNDCTGRIMSSFHSSDTNGEVLQAGGC